MIGGLAMMLCSTFAGILLIGIYERVGQYITWEYLGGVTSVCSLSDRGGSVFDRSSVHLDTHVMFLLSAYFS